MPIALKRFWFQTILGYTPLSMPMVQYWKYRIAVQGITKRQKDGSTIMKLDGEEHPLSGIPRSHLLFGDFEGTGHGPLSVLKHRVKNQIFNESWYALEKGASPREVVKNAVRIVPEIYRVYQAIKLDIVPPESMTPCVREIHRAWTKAAPGNTSYMLRDILCMVLQEDDAYRNRVQWIATHFSWLLKWINPVKCLDTAFAFLEHAEVIDDMKERQRLLRRIVMTALAQPEVRTKFLAFWKECDWNKVKLSEADKYHFRGKYFKVDLDKFEY